MVLVTAVSQDERPGLDLAIDGTDEVTPDGWLIKGGGARVNDVAIKGETQPVSLADLDPQGLIKLSAGRKRHALVRPA